VIDEIDMVLAAMHGWRPPSCWVCTWCRRFV
jgi:hypothetical protein